MKINSLPIIRCLVTQTVIILFFTTLILSKTNALMTINLYEHLMICKGLKYYTVFI